MFRLTAFRYEISENPIYGNEWALDVRTVVNGTESTSYRILMAEDLTDQLPFETLVEYHTRQAVSALHAALKRKAEDGVGN
jgi:hypothetical protein